MANPHGSLSTKNLRCIRLAFNFTMTKLLAVDKKTDLKFFRSYASKVTGRFALFDDMSCSFHGIIIPLEKLASMV
jgi:hypothetical protein